MFFLPTHLGFLERSLWNVGLNFPRHLNSIEWLPPPAPSRTAPCQRRRCLPIHLLRRHTLLARRNHRCPILLFPLCWMRGQIYKAQKTLNVRRCYSVLPQSLWIALSGEIMTYHFVDPRPFMPRGCHKVEVPSRKAMSRAVKGLRGRNSDVAIVTIEPMPAEQVSLIQFTSY